MAAPSGGLGRAMSRPASALAPGELGGRPFSFPQAVQPVLDARCVSCHGGEKTEGGVDLRGLPERGFSRAYWALCGPPPKALPNSPPRPAEPLVPRFAQRNQVQQTPPGGQIGARGSRLMKLLCQGAGHYGVKLSPAEVGRLAAWIDLNAVFYGTYDRESQAAEMEGKPVAMPAIQ
jgi:hypothetical protein